MFLNIGNNGFQEILRSDYVDKTGLIGLVNRKIGTKEKLICISRPRRFGKSYAAQMLCAYYDKSVDSSELFQGLEITRDETYEQYRNRYNVIYVDLTGTKPATNGYREIESYLTERISEEVKAAYPDVIIRNTLIETLQGAVRVTGNRFIMIIDEWDSPIRENPEVERDYLEFLRSLFKNSAATAEVFAAAYMTGILPIRKDGSQSAISEFNEFTMLDPGDYAPYIGFSEQEVREICDKKQVGFGEMRRWYDGYSYPNAHSLYNPNSVMKAARSGRYMSYWSQTSAASGLIEYLNRGYHGFGQMLQKLFAGTAVPVDPTDFPNDLITFRDNNDILTLMIHLGYLAYDLEQQTVRIPNEEIMREFQRAIRFVDHQETLQRLKESDQLFQDIFDGNEEAVASQIEKVHMEESTPLFYNNEQCLRSVVKEAMYTYRDHYLRAEEIPGGKGFADVVYLPKDPGYPALVVELKWNKAPEAAIAQIRNRDYPQVLKGFNSAIYLVGITYRPDGDRKHSCIIERMNDE